MVDLGYRLYAGSNEGVLLVRWHRGGACFTTAEVEALLAPWKALVSEYKTMYPDLLEKYHALKLSGATVPEPPKTLERPEFDPVMAAITAKAGPDRRLRAQMSAEVMRSRQAGVPDIEIIQAIEQGVTVDDEEGVVL